MSNILKYLRVSLTVLLITGFIFVAHAVIYYAGAVLWPEVFALHWEAFRDLLFVLGLSFIVGSIFASRYNNLFTRSLYYIASVWLGLFAYLFLAAMSYAIIGWISHFAGLEIPVVFGRALMALAAAAAVYGLFHARSMKVRHITVPMPHLPASWQGRKTVFLSDMHLGQIHTKEFARKVWSTVERLHPDLILIGGDLFDGVKVREEEVIAPLKLWTPALGTYFVTGNHEEFSSSAHFLSAIEEMGIHHLENKLIVIDGLQLVGMTDHDSTDKNKFPEILRGLNIDRSKPTIFLKHQPSGLDISEAAGVHLHLSGHTHRAQQWPLNVFTRWIFKGYDYGLKPFGRMNVYTTSGVGTWGPPMRVGSDSEIVVLTFTPS